MTLPQLRRDPLPPALAAVSAAVASCARCPRLVARRHDVRGGPVPGFGDPDAAVHVLGLATAAAGNPTGRPFTGNRSAAFLVAGLHRVGFADRPTSQHAGDGLILRDAWLASAVRCAPPANRPLAVERDACAHHLRAEWRALPRLRVVVALGALAWEAACRVAGVRHRARFRHGAEVVASAGVRVLACYHPSPQNTNTGLLTADMLDAVLRRARALADLPEAP